MAFGGASCAVRKGGSFGPVSPDGQGDRRHCRVPVCRTAQILTQSKNSGNEFKRCFTLQTPDCCSNLLLLPGGCSSPPVVGGVQGGRGTALILMGAVPALCGNTPLDMCLVSGSLRPPSCWACTSGVCLGVSARARATRSAARRVRWFSCAQTENTLRRVSQRRPVTYYFRCWRPDGAEYTQETALSLLPVRSARAQARPVAVLPVPPGVPWATAAGHFRAEGPALWGSWWAVRTDTSLQSISVSIPFCCHPSSSVALVQRCNSSVVCLRAVQSGGYTRGRCIAKVYTVAGEIRTILPATPRAVTQQQWRQH